MRGREVKKTKEGEKRENLRNLKRISVEETWRGKVTKRRGCK